MNQVVGDGGAQVFPRLESAGRPVNAKRHVAKGTGLWTSVGYGVVGLLTLCTLGVFLLLLFVGWLVQHFFSKRIMGRVRGSTVQVGSAQLPEIHRVVTEYCSRLGVAQVPEVFVMESSEINAFALKVGGRGSVILNDDVVWGAVEHGSTSALRFIIAHELAHHALGHTGTLRSYMRHVIPKLSRLDELSCDAVALQLVGTHEAAYEGIMMLTAGPQLLKYVSREQLLIQAGRVGEDKVTKKAEAQLTHPLLLNRLYVLRSTEITQV